MCIGSPGKRAGTWLDVCGQRNGQASILFASFAAAAVFFSPPGFSISRDRAVPSPPLFPSSSDRHLSSMHSCTPHTHPLFPAAPSTDSFATLLPRPWKRRPPSGPPRPTTRPRQKINVPCNPCIMHSHFVERTNERTARKFTSCLFLSPHTRARSSLPLLSLALSSLVMPPLPSTFLFASLLRSLDDYPYSFAFIYIYIYLFLFLRIFISLSVGFPSSLFRP